jgi:hypothetical protein
MGLVLFADGDDNSPLQHVATVREVFARVQKPVLLIVFGKSIEPMTWMFNDHDESEKFIRVEIDSKGKNRRKNADYRVIPVDQLGVTFDDEAAFLVSQAICNQLGKVVSSEQGMEKQCFEKKLYHQMAIVFGIVFLLVCSQKGFAESNVLRMAGLSTSDKRS